MPNQLSVRSLKKPSWSGALGLWLREADYLPKDTCDTCATATIEFVSFDSP